jgi:hypothetical protein
VVAWYDNEWGYSNRLVELTADTGRVLNGGDDQTKIEGPIAPDNKVENTQTPDTAPHVELKHEDLLSAPTTDDFLPPPIGQVDAPVHNTKEDPNSVEANPGPDGPAQTLPQLGAPAILPDSQTPGPEKPHEF